ncbi:mandelate racemase/muconate lactonizing enzyme family protein [Chelativorans alearense]|uniref:mandelate racemase/muconate lactonizing enzyme family protein n=1 Tax=Chelativorans alearense TaxID=2681495 RepID=UPI0013D7E7C2|nr:enolase C-terminal domain-like protein [Chelativorans alearense]
MTTPYSVTEIEVMQACVPLREPVQLGAQTIERRDYVVVRLDLESGAQGYAIGYDRGLPLFDLALVAGRHYLGTTPALRNETRRIAMGSTPAPRAAMTRGVSLFDVALWDAWCQSLGLPLWAMLGGAREAVPVMPVIGYGMTPDKAASEAAELSAQGFKTIKLMIDGRDYATDEKVMEALAGALPESCRFGIDAHWSWTTEAGALPHCRLAERLGAVFIEDPFAPSEWRVAKGLAARLDTPLAMGEDVTDINGFRDLTEAASILRVDASVSGGIGGTLEALALARAHGRSVIPHVFPFLHLHFALAHPHVQAIEMIMPEVGADPIDDFFLHRPAIENGMMRADETPGAGLAVNWEDLAKFKTRHERLMR